MTQDRSKTFFKFLVLILKPVARLCLRRGLKIQDFLSAAKVSLVAAATEILEEGGEKVNVSRIAVVTGLQRRDVNALLAEAESGEGLRRGNILVKVIGQWQHDRRFVTKSRKPRVLTVEGAESQFADLVQSVSKDLNPYTVLFELERIGAVEKTVKGLKLKVRAFQSTEDVEEGLVMLAADSSDLVSAVEENLFDEPTIPNLHIRTEYDNVVVDKAEEIREWFLEKGAKFHHEARSYLSQFDKDLNQGLYDKKGGVRVSIGSFSNIDFEEQGEE